MVDTAPSVESKEFSRERKLTLPIVIVRILGMVRPGRRFGYKEVTYRFYGETEPAHQQGFEESPPHKPAFCHFRQKLSLGVFREFSGKTVANAGETAARIGGATWKGFRVLAIDGTKKIMPYPKQLEAFFGIPSSSFFHSDAGLLAQPHLAKNRVNLVYGRFYSSEGDMARLLYKDLGKRDLLRLDGCCASLELLSGMFSSGFQFLIRMPTSPEGVFKV